MVFKVNIKQRQGLAEFFGNLAVGWLISGFIVPALSGEFFGSALRTVAITIVWTGVSVFNMLYLLKNES